MICLISSPGIVCIYGEKENSAYITLIHSSKQVKDCNINLITFLEEKNGRISFIPWDVERFLAKFKCWIYQPHKINMFVSIKWHIK